MRGVLLRASSMIALGCSSVTYAEDQAAQTANPAQVQQSDEGKPSTKLEEIIVTATRREQDVQKVPIAVSAFGHEALKKAGVQDIRDLQILAPSLIVASTGSDSYGTSFRVRGVGTVGLNPGLESSVGTFVDGVYRSRSTVGLADLPGVDRVELLRGPQGTLFGKNTTAGLLNITTAAPSFQESYEATATYGNYNTVELGAGVSGPIVADVLAARIDVGYRRADGYLTDRVTGQKYVNRDHKSVRAQIAWTPSADLKIRLIGDYSERADDDLDTQVYKVVNPASAALLAALGGVVPVAGVSAYKVALNRPPQDDVKEGGGSAQIDWTSGLGTLISITSYRDWRHVGSWDVDQTTLDILYADQNSEHFRTFTQEVRLQNTIGKLDLVIGGYFANENLKTTANYKAGADLERYLDAALSPSGFPGFTSFTGLPYGQNFPAGGGANKDLFEQTARSFAAFTQSTYHLTDRFSLTGGLRFTTERKTVAANLAVTNPGCSAVVAKGLVPYLASIGLDQVFCGANFDIRRNGTFGGQRTESRVTGVASASYAFSDGINGYASFSRGYKAGGYNLDRSGFEDPLRAPPSIDQLTYKPESVNAYEIGFKTRLFDRKVTINTALFYSDFSDFQLTYNAGTSLLTLNVPQVLSKGIEIEAAWAVTRAIRFSGGATYADTKYGAVPSTFPMAVQDLSHRQLANAPLWVMSGSAGYDDAIKGTRLRGFVQANARWQSSQQTENLLSPLGGEHAYAIVDARAGIGSPSQSWTLELFARNLFDERRLQQSINTTLSFNLNHSGWPIEPRKFGITLSVKG